MRRPELAALVAMHGPGKRINELVPFTTPVEIRDAYSGLVINDAALAPLRGLDADAGYEATRPIPAGASKSALILKQTPTGCVLSLTAKQEGVDDHQRSILKRMYGNRARAIRETGTFPGTDTRQLTENDTDGD